MHEATISFSETAGTCLCIKIGFYWRCEREHGPVEWWILHFWGAVSYHARQGKISSMYTFVLTLVPCFTKIRGDFQVFDTAAQTMTYAGFWRRSTVNMSSVTSSECWTSTLSFCGLIFASKVNTFSSEKTFSPFCVPDFSKFQKRPALSDLFRCWRIVRCWHFFGFKKEKLRSYLQLSSLILGPFKIRSHF